MYRTYLNVELVVGAASQAFKGVCNVGWVYLHSVPIAEFPLKMYKIVLLVFSRKFILNIIIK